MVVVACGYSGMWTVIEDEDDRIVAIDGDGGNNVWVSTKIKKGFTYT